MFFLPGCVLKEVVECSLPCLARPFKVVPQIAPWFEKCKHTCTVESFRLFIVTVRKPVTDKVGEVAMAKGTDYPLNAVGFGVKRQ